ncbi:hypothetical protein KEM54_005196 [Ascosphaera aggregata]|nr:hypothetical protein KEM54_005196 [Ascosphaera aggregata]
MPSTQLPRRNNSRSPIAGARSGTDAAATMSDWNTEPGVVGALARMVCACSRLADYRHDIYDVTAGSLLGLFIAYLTFRHYFPPINHVQCHNPFERGVRPESGGFRRVAADDEEACIDNAPGNAELSQDGAIDSPYPSYLLRPRAS